MLTLRPYQQECINAIPESGAHLIQMAVGLGKCFARGTKILMFNGDIKAVEDIVNGDVVMGWDSKPRTVKNIARGNEEMYFVRRAKHEPYIVNKSHILSLTPTGKKKTITDNRGNKYRVGDICNIEVTDYLQCSYTFKRNMKGFCVSVEFEEQPLIIEPYILGLWLGDGCKNGLKFTTPDAEIVNALQEYANDNCFELKEVKGSNSGKAKEYALVDWKQNTPIRKYFRETLKCNKHIPKEYLINSKENRLQLLAGLLDTDGYLNAIDNATFEFCTQYKHLQEQVAFLCRSLGLTARCFERFNRQYNRDYYYISIFGKTDDIPTRIKRKQARRSPNKDNLHHRIEVIPIGIDRYYGFELEGDDRMFLLWDCTVVHNTVTFANIPRRGRMLILSHREELVNQPRKYFTCSYGIEQGKNHSNGEEVVSASVQSIVRRLEHFNPDDFDIIVTDEAHHAASPTYRKIYDYFKPRLHLGFTATPSRGDGIGLSQIYSDIIFQRDIRWGIENGYLSPIKCLQAEVDYNLDSVRCRMGDYNLDELDKAVNQDAVNNAVAQAYRDKAKGQTLIFGVSVDHCQKIADLIPGAVCIHAKTPNRAEMIQDFLNRKIKCIVNCGIFTEGTDLPLVETVIIARPTQSTAFYTQMVGRGTRLAEGKEYLTLIDCVGISTKHNLCTAPTLIGLDISNLSKATRAKVEGDLFELEAIAEREYKRSATSIVKAYKEINIWALDNKIDLCGLSFTRTVDGRLIVPVRGKQFVIPKPDHLGQVNGKPLSEVIQALREKLEKEYPFDQYIWDKATAKRKWGTGKASQKQIDYIQHLSKEPFNFDKLTKYEASQLIGALKNV